MADVIPLPVVRVERAAGNGAREALIATALSLPNTSLDDAEKWADWILLELGGSGFKVVPLN